MDKETTKQNIDKVIKFIHILRDSLGPKEQASDTDFKEAKKLADDLRKKTAENVVFQDKVDREKGNGNKDVSAI